MSGLVGLAASSVVLFACAGCGSPASREASTTTKAASPDRVATTFERIASQYRKRQPIAIDFVQTTHNYVFAAEATSQGVVYVRPPKVRFDYLSPDREVVQRSFVIDPPFIVSVDHVRRERCRRRQPTPLIYAALIGGLDQRASSTSERHASDLILILSLRPLSDKEGWSEATLRVDRDTLQIRSLDVVRERERDSNALRFASARPITRLPALSVDGYRCPDP